MFILSTDPWFRPREVKNAKYEMLLWETDGKGVWVNKRTKESQRALESEIYGVLDHERGKMTEFKDGTFYENLRYKEGGFSKDVIEKIEGCRGVCYANCEFSELSSNRCEVRDTDL